MLWVKLSRFTINTIDLLNVAVISMLTLIENFNIRQTMKYTSHFHSSFRPLIFAKLVLQQTDLIEAWKA